MSTPSRALERARHLLATIPVDPRCTAQLAGWELALLGVRARLAAAVEGTSALTPVLRDCAARLEEAAGLVAPSSLTLAETMVEASVVLWLVIPDVARAVATADQFLGLAHAAPDRHPRVLGLLGVSSPEALRALLPGSPQ